MEMDRPCEFKELCEECHPEPTMEEKRKGCSEGTCYRCGVFWSFRDGYLGMDED